MCIYVYTYTIHTYEFMYNRYIHLLTIHAYEFMYNKFIHICEFVYRMQSVLILPACFHSSTNTVLITSVWRVWGL